MSPAVCLCSRLSHVSRFHFVNNNLTAEEDELLVACSATPLTRTMPDSCLMSHSRHASTSIIKQHSKVKQRLLLLAKHQLQLSILPSINCQISFAATWPPLMLYSIKAHEFDNLKSCFFSGSSLSSSYQDRLLPASPTCTWRISLTQA